MLPFLTSLSLNLKFAAYWAPSVKDNGFNTLAAWPDKSKITFTDKIGLIKCNQYIDFILLAAT